MEPNKTNVTVQYEPKDIKMNVFLRIRPLKNKEKQSKNYEFV
jgi:hypothetical protein